MPSSPSRTSPRPAVRGGSTRRATAATDDRASPPSERSPRDPLAQQRVDDDVLAAFLEDQVLLEESGKRRLDARRPAEAVACANVSGEQALSVLQHDRAKHRALGQRQPLPDRL